MEHTWTPFVLLLYSVASNLGTTSSNHLVTPACKPDTEVCEFSLIVKRSLTMTTEIPGGTIYQRGPIVAFPNGTYGVRVRPACDSVQPVDAKVIYDEVTVDGTYRTLVTMNDQMPGPPIVVYGGQEVVVNVTNHLLSDTLTVHWHGQHQMGTPWMDGTGEVTQCPIVPGETFTYRFVAHPAGTFWYHSHEGVQRAEGVYGLFVVLPSPGSTLDKVIKEKYPEFSADYIVNVQEFYEQSSEEVYLQWIWDMGRYANDYGNLTNCHDETLNVDGYRNAYIPPRSMLINGKGWYYPEQSSIPENTAIPLDIFKVRKGHKYRFRLNNGGLALTLRVSIDSHVMYVMSVDSFLVQSEGVESIMIAPGERYDFWINATDPDGTGLYWIRVEGIEWAKNGPDDKTQKVLPVHGEAFLHYEDVLPGWTQSLGVPSLEQRRQCTEVTPCRILNCPYQYYPRDSHMTCIILTSLKPAMPERPLKTRSGDITYDKFFHLHYAGSHHRSPALVATIDHKMFRLPVIPPQIYPKVPWAGGEGLCYLDDICEKDFCPCTHVMKVDLGAVVQVTIMVMAHKNNPTPASHPFHIHGHAFQVIKIGYPKYDVTTGKVLGQSEDVRCADGEMHCNYPEWTNKSWINGNLPGVASDVIRKDTVAIPVGGYVVIRFETTNPGFWFAHCHMVFHAAQGMALIIQEGEMEQMPPVPKNFKSCGSFIWSDDDFRKQTNFQYGKDTYQTDLDYQRYYNIPRTDSGPDILPTSYAVIQVALGVTSIFLLASIIVSVVLLYKLRRERRGYSKLSSGAYPSDASEED
ncbi:hypothetical protein LSH36_21g09034 [Paralvinella palmiformis]|uniref:Laccase n=1 Tax=Paralvinella palmiformis TaxID=53620 RepID=A0AAD9KCA9_9ANNE|nr:hypothetical protein LSH36_21g09034 [Paralvinella palmiformis]